MKETVKASNDTRVESSLGWSVEITSPDVLVYSEEERSLLLEIEEHGKGGSPEEWIIHWPAVWGWNGRKEDPISQQKRYEILDRIELAFWKLDMEIKEIV